MTHTSTYTLFAEDPPAQPQPGQGPGAGGPMNPLLILVMIMLFMFIVVMPAMNRRQRREQEALFANLKRGSKVLTNAGIVGVIVSAKDGEDEIVIKSEDTRLRIKRNVVVQVIGTDESEAAKG